MTAVEENEDFVLRFRPCEMESKPANQRWFIGGDGGEDDDTKIRSAVDASQCIALVRVREDSSLETARGRLADCDEDWTDYDFKGFGNILVTSEDVGDESYCLTNRGASADVGDYIWARKCKNRKDNVWVAVPSFVSSEDSVAIANSPRLDQPGVKQMLYALLGGGCIQPRETTIYVVLDDCQESLAWRLEAILGTTSYLFHSALDDTLCLEVQSTWYDDDWDFSDYNPARPPKLYTRTCDSEEPFQHFSFGDHGILIHFDVAPELCVSYSSPNRFSSIILQECDEASPDKPLVTIPIRDATTCLSSDVPEFVIDGETSLGDPLVYNGAVVEKCGKDCYIIQDVGTDPGSYPDAQQVGYKMVSSENFSFLAKVCPSVCFNRDYPRSKFGKAGLFIRSGLDEDDYGYYGSNYVWTSRSKEDGDEHPDDDPCEWLYLERNGDEITRAKGSPDKLNPCQVNWYHNRTETFESADLDDLYVGMFVSSPSEEEFGHCIATEAVFEHIECRGC
jgi:hypothetical protein